MARKLPEEFRRRMAALLGEQAEAFFAALETGAAVRGVRHNPIKVCREDFLASCPIPLLPLPYAEDGFYTEAPARGIGSHPFHHAGMAYLQDPGAMAALSAVKLSRGDRAIDLCAAPGGKSSQIAAMIGEEGFLLANEFQPKRARAMVGNFERLGIRNAFVTSLDTAVFPKLFSDWFDFALVDAPCSGEGMFRKSDEALADWNIGNIEACAARQREILENASGLVRRGGRLMYSTCTWSPEEDERIVDEFLENHPDYRLIDADERVRAVTADGVSFPGAKHGDTLKKCRRFYPHLFPGEGQFLALFERTGGGAERKILYQSAGKPLGKEEERALRAALAGMMERMPEGVLLRSGEQIVLAPQVPLPPKSLFMAGVLLGEWKGRTFQPSHQFFSAYGKDFRIRIDLSDGEALSYLHGEEIALSDERSGYAAVFWHHAALGGGKLSGGRLKNHYPKGLRNPSASLPDLSAEDRQKDGD